MLFAHLHAGDGWPTRLWVLYFLDTAKSGSRKAAATKPTTSIFLIFIWRDGTEKST